MADSRRSRAKELQRMCTEGPAFAFLGGPPGQPGNLTEEARRQYRIWADSWVLPLLNELVPELKAEV